MSQTHDHPSHEEAVAKIGELVHELGICMMTTQTPDGSLRSRPMQTHKDEDRAKHTDFDGTVWFFTDKSSGKVGEIMDEQHVNLAFSSNSEQKYLSISGRATLVRDRAKMEELWNPAYKAWFPDGLDDPNISLLKVRAEEAEYWDTPGSAVVHAIGFVKAVATGQRYQPGENERVGL